MKGVREVKRQARHLAVVKAASQRVLAFALAGSTYYTIVIAPSPFSLLICLHEDIIPV
jgi:hypothetical protein